jgi:hypothetical protein
MSEADLPKKLKVFKGDTKFSVYHDPKSNRVLVVLTMDGDSVGLPMRPSEARSLAAFLSSAAAGASHDPPVGVA